MGAIACRLERRPFEENQRPPAQGGLRLIARTESHPWQGFGRRTTWCGSLIGNPPRPSRHPSDGGDFHGSRAGLLSCLRPHLRQWITETIEGGRL